MLNFTNPYIGKYELIIEYIYKNLTKTINYNLTVNPIFYYTENNQTFYYGYDNCSSLPIFKPYNGIFYFCDDNLNEINIYNNIILEEKNDTILINRKNGQIIIKPNANVNIYNLSICYELNNIKSKFIYSFEIIPFLFYYNTTLIYGSDKLIEKYIAPLGGKFKVLNYKLDINDIGDIDIKSLCPNKYNIQIEYIYNNKSYFTNCKLLIKPFIDFSNNKIICLPENGILYMNNIIVNQIGQYKLNINYNYNNINSKININLLISTNIFYENNNIELYYDESIIIYPLIKYGKYTSTFEIVNENGEININNVDIGIYNFIICYSNNDYIYDINFTISIKPKIRYENITIEYGNSKITPIFKYPKNGKIIYNNTYKNIIYDTTGTIIINFAYPLIYTFSIDYIFNKSDNQRRTGIVADFFCCKS
jgi:hypothetical protein